MLAFPVIENIANRLPYGFGHVADLSAAGPRGARSPLIARIAAYLATRAQRLATFQALTAMSDRELADIGLRREDIRSVFDAAFAARHDAARLRRAA